MNSTLARKMLDRALARSGRTVTLRRMSGVAPSQTSKDVTVRALVRAISAEEIAAGINQANRKVILSPTEIAAAGWPVGESPSTTVANPSIPRANDKCIFEGRTWNVVAPVNPIYVNDVLVRIELQVAG